MRRPYEGESPDLVLDGHAWRFDTWPDAAQVRHKLAGYRGAEWPDWLATRARLEPEHTAALAILRANKPRQKRARKV
jgi:hypothetical protein